jgi:hypothetical protein
MQDNCSLQVLWIRNTISMVSLKPILAKLRLHELNLNVFVPLYFMAQNFDLRIKSIHNETQTCLDQDVKMALISDSQSQYLLVLANYNIIQINLIP